MELTHTEHTERITEEGVELLRLRIAYPEATGKGTEQFNSFYRELAERSVRYASGKLKETLTGLYSSLPVHERRFRFPRRIYSVFAEAEEEGEGIVRVMLCVSLSEKKMSGSPAKETTQRYEQRWLFCGDRSYLLPAQKPVRNSARGSRNRM